MKIQSTAKEIKPLEILANKVYLRTNIERIITEDREKSFDGWEYNEEQISIADYFEKTKSDIDYLAIMGGVNL